MNFIRRAAVVASICMVAACSGGGGGSNSNPGPAWPRFRHDANNSGAATGLVAQNSGLVKATLDLGGPIASSPAITNDGRVFIATESCSAASCSSSSGALVAVAPDPIRLQWSTRSNSTCADGAPLGQLVSSPAIYDLDGDISIFIGSESGRVHAFKTKSDSTQPTSVFCFDPTLSSGSSKVASAKFTSSPAYLVSAVSRAIDGVFIGASVTTTSGATQGRLYSLANDGSIRWEYPRNGAPSIAPISSSPALGASAIYFITDDGVLYALTLDGNFKWSHNLGAVRDPDAPFSVSPISSPTGVFAGTADGTFIAFNLDGSERWRRTDSTGTRLLAGSLALSAQPPSPEPTVTSTPVETYTAVPTPTGSVTATPTPTPTEIPLLSTAALFGVTKTGELVIYEAAAPTPRNPTPRPTVEEEVIGSPAVSPDGQIVFASASGTVGRLYVLDVLTGQPPATPTGTPSPNPWPKILDGAGFQSSPSIDHDGTIWIGGRNGILYAIGNE